MRIRLHLSGLRLFVTTIIVVAGVAVAWPLNTPEVVWLTILAVVLGARIETG